MEILSHDGVNTKISYRFENDRGRSQGRKIHQGPLYTTAGVSAGRIFWMMLVHTYLYVCVFQCLLDIVRDQDTWLDGSVI